jgi:hypothetical protein
MIPSLLVEQRHVCHRQLLCFCGLNLTDTFRGRSVTDFNFVVVNVCGFKVTDTLCGCNRTKSYINISMRIQI